MKEKMTRKVDCNEPGGWMTLPGESHEILWMIPPPQVFPEADRVASISNVSRSNAARPSLVQQNWTRCRSDGWMLP